MEAGMEILKRKVLIAEDNPVEAEPVKAFLEEGGYTVIIATDGQEAVRLFREQHPDLVLLDYMMPGMDGIGVLKAIKSLDPLAIVLIITGQGTEDLAVKAMKAGAFDYVSKPIDFDFLAHTVNQLIHDHDIMVENQRLKDRGDAFKDYLVTLSETMGEALVTTDDQGRMVFLNYHAREIWGIEEENRGKYIDILFNNISSNIFHELQGRLLAGAASLEEEYSFKRRDGSVFHGRMNASMLRGEMHAGGIVFVVRDLTEETEMRRRMIDAEKMATLGKVVEGVAHEVRNSMTSLGGFTRRLQLSGGLDEHQSMYVDFIIDDVKRLEASVKDIEEYVNYTKIHRPHFQLASIQQILERALEELFQDGRRSGIRTELDVPEDAPEIYADADYLKEAFIHLFENACDAMAGKGLLRVSVHCNAEYLYVDVVDTGCGIPQEEIKDIFNPFYTSKTRGAGVGLTKVFMISEEHGGYVTARSSDKGTSMRVYLSRRRNILEGKLL